MATVIVALPELGDQTYRVSSEEVPHLTLVYLGENVTPEQAVKVAETTAHMATKLDRFDLTVDRRGTLGNDKADVLFFEGLFLSRVREFRANLLKDNLIQQLYYSIDQYPEWTPHLTLGYPEAPARQTNNEDHPIHLVRFDRIAVWTGDYQGPEFQLTDYVVGLEAVMSDTTTNDLVHYGKKGMKWGVRNDEGHQGERVKTKKLDKLDKKWEKENTGARGYFKIHNAAAQQMNNRVINEINSNPKYKDIKDFGDLSHPKVQEYHKEFSDAFNREFAQAAVNLGTNPSGTKKYVMEVDKNDGQIQARLRPIAKDAVHAETDETKELYYEFKIGSTGRLVKMEPKMGVLKHYGVKGMKWGVTKTDRATSPEIRRQTVSMRGPKEITVTQRKAGTYVKTKGGTRQKASDDAVRAAAGRQKIKRSSMDSLTNDELKAVVDRMQLEQKYTRLKKSDINRGNGFIRRFLQSPEGKKTAEDLWKRVQEKNK